jgi:hypothetical protein
VNLINLKYAAEAIFLLGIAFRLLRWVAGALAEGDAPPSAFVDEQPVAAYRPPSGQPLTIGLTSTNRPPISQPALLPQLTITTATPPSLLGTLENLAAQAREDAVPPHAGDPALFPQAMLDAMTPEQRAQVLNTLVKQRAGATGR